MSGDHDWLCTKEAAQMCAVSAAQMWRMRKRYNGPSFHRLGGKVMYRRSDIEEWIDRMRVACE
jgi:predicted DNA-binding transcriptional regulator AlpA